jgi:hypothetical protein
MVFIPASDTLADAYEEFTAHMAVPPGLRVWNGPTIGFVDVGNGE